VGTGLNGMRHGVAFLRRKVVQEKKNELLKVGPIRECLFGLLFVSGRNFLEFSVPFGVTINPFICRNPSGDDHRRGGLLSQATYLGNLGKALNLEIRFEKAILKRDCQGGAAV